MSRTERDVKLTLDGGETAARLLLNMCNSDKEGRVFITSNQLDVALRFTQLKSRCCSEGRRETQ